MGRGGGCVANVWFWTYLEMPTSLPSGDAEQVVKHTS